MNLSVYQICFHSPMFDGVAVSVATDKKHAEKMTIRRLRKDWQVDVDTIQKMDTKRISQLGEIETKKFAEIVHLDTRL